MNEISLVFYVFAVKKNFLVTSIEGVSFFPYFKNPNFTFIYLELFWIVFFILPLPDYVL